MLKFFKKEPKEILDCLGYYDSKPYHSLNYALVYAQDTLILENEQVKVYSRNFHGTVFVITLVENEKEIYACDYTYEKLKNKITEKGIEEGNASIQIVVFKNKNETTILEAKKQVENTKKAFYQTLIYNSQKVRLEYYRPVPKFYKLYDHFTEAIYFDLSAIDPTR